MHLPIEVKSPNNISKWQMGFSSGFKGKIVFQLPVIILLVAKKEFNSQ
jgi:hypothetical protein